MTIRVPLFFGTPEPIEAIALVSKAAELLGLGLAVRFGAFSHLRRITQAVHSRLRATVTGTTALT